MKILSWNVNGVRAIQRKGNFSEVFKKYDPDIVCLQETKAAPDQLDEEIRNPDSFYSYFSSSDVKKGYSGVALYSKTEPEHISCGIGASGDDDEGRVIETHFKDPFPFVLLNVYFPNGGGGPERLRYKLDFYDDFLAHIESLRKKGHSIIFCGDVNTAHQEIDLARPKANETNTGFLPEERAWLDQVEEHGYIDVFRHFYPNKTEAYTYWDMKTRARDRNVGWRIDYFFVSSDITGRLKQISHRTEQYGSDHCPVELELS